MTATMEETRLLSDDDAKRLHLHVTGLKRTLSALKLAGLEDSRRAVELAEERRAVRAVLDADRKRRQDEQSEQWRRQHERDEALQARERKIEADTRRSVEWLRDRLAGTMAEPRREVLAAAEREGVGQLNAAVRELGVRELGAEFILGTNAHTREPYWSLTRRPRIDRPAEV